MPKLLSIIKQLPLFSVVTVLLSVEKSASLTATTVYEPLRKMVVTKIKHRSFWAATDSATECVSLAKHKRMYFWFLIGCKKRFPPPFAPTYSFLMSRVQWWCQFYKKMNINLSFTQNDTKIGFFSSKHNVTLGNFEHIQKYIWLEHLNYRNSSLPQPLHEIKAKTLQNAIYHHFHTFKP